MVAVRESRREWARLCEGETVKLKEGSQYYRLLCECCSGQALYRRRSWAKSVR